MKKLLQTIFITAIVCGLASSCKKSFDELSLNENKPSAVPPSLLLNGIVNDMVDKPYSMNERWGQYFLCNYDYYGNNRYDFGAGSNYYSTLKNVIKMEEEAAKLDPSPGNPYLALSKFMKAYFFSRMSLQMGDMPLNDALKGVENLTPKYDSQKEVFKKVFAWLDSANNELAAINAAGVATISGDIFYGNDLKKWRKAVNAYRLRMLVNLSKKEADADLAIKQQFSNIIGDPVKYPLFSGSEDNMQYLFLHPTNDYPMNPSNFGFDALRYNTSATYISLLTQKKDPRVYFTAEPASTIVTGGTSPTSFAAFVGAPPGEDLGVMYAKANSGQYSLINRYRYYETYTGEPSIQLGYAEMMFNIAEAINRGWIPKGPVGNAEEYYKEGIKASLLSYGIPLSGNFEVSFLASGTPGISATYNRYPASFDFDTYYSQLPVKYTDGSVGLKEILEQKYVALFRHSGLEGYFQNRRTGIPAFTTGPGTGNGTRIAKRFQYFGSEKTANNSNYSSALQSQFGGQDDINATMWVIQ